MSFRSDRVIDIGVCFLCWRWSLLLLHDEIMRMKMMMCMMSIAVVGTIEFFPTGDDDVDGAFGDARGKVNSIGDDGGAVVRFVDYVEGYAYDCFWCECG